jgi:trimethylguanosine synthase
LEATPGRAAPSFPKQPALLPESVPPGLVVAAAHRRTQEISQFFGTLEQQNHSASNETVTKLCMLVVTETSLVHYTKRPKKLAMCKPTVESEVQDSHEARFVAQIDSDITEKASGTPAVPIDEKYWKRRYNYFSRFDEGIRMDVAAWFEVTPESVARHIADRMPYNLVVDGTCGVGGNAIQFAMTSRRVIGVDTDSQRLQDAAHNAAIYGVQDRIDYVCDDFAHFATTYEGPQIDAVFLSPPWGGPSHLDSGHFSLKDVSCPDIVHLFAAAAAVSPRVVLYLPRHADLNEGKRGEAPMK